MVGFLIWKPTLSVGILETLIPYNYLVVLNFFSNHTFKSSSAKLLSNHFLPSLGFVIWITLTHMQDIALALLNLTFTQTRLWSLSRSPFLPACWCTDSGTVNKSAEGALNLTVHVNNIDIKQHWSQYRSLRNTSHHYSPLGHWDLTAIF